MTVINSVIQARMGSTRFPGKTLAEINSVTCLEFLTTRIRKSKFLNKVVVATSSLPEDEAVVMECERLGLDCFTGSEADVHGRISDCLELYSCDFFLRITGDDILIDHNIIDFFCNIILKEKPDFLSSFESKTFPNGFVISGFKRDNFILHNKETMSKFDREHIISFYLRNKDKFNYYSVQAKEKWKGYGLNFAIDEVSDLAKINLNFEANLVQSSSEEIIYEVKNNNNLRKLFSDGGKY